VNVKILISISIVVAISIVLVFTTSESTPESISEPNYEINFVYSDIDKIQEILATQNLILSTSVEITDITVSQYCTFFDDENVQKFVKYCTTAALLDSDGTPLGNINMGGNSDYSTMALAIIEVSTLDSKASEIDFVFQTMIETLVCDCWEKLQPGGFESVSLWLDTAKERYAESSQTTLKSKISGLDEKQLILEITSTEKSYLWTLIIVK
jgi:hypothetical protein